MEPRVEPTRLYRLRTQARLRQADLAKQATTSIKMIGHAEHRSHTIGPKLQARIAAVFDVPIPYLFDEAGIAITEKPVKVKLTPAEREVVRLTRLGMTRPFIVNTVDEIESAYEVWRVQRDAGLLPLDRGGGKP